MKSPQDLRALFGDRFKITLDESAYCEPGGRKNPQYYQIPCKYGHIYPHSDRMLAFSCESGVIRQRLRRDHPDIEVRQWSDIGEAVFLFRPGQFDMIAAYARPRRRRRISSAEKTRLAEVGRAALKRTQKATIIGSTESAERRSKSLR